MSGCHGDLHARNEACATDATNWNGTPTHRIAAYVSAAGTTAADLGPANAAMAGAAAMDSEIATTKPSSAASATASETIDVPSSSSSSSPFAFTRVLFFFRMRSCATNVVVATASDEDRR